MSRRKSLSTIVLIGVLVLLVAPISVFAGTATATATAAGGERCGDISKYRNQTTGAMEVKKVEINGVKVDPSEYTVTNDGSTRPKIEFNDSLNANDVVTVTLNTKKGRRHTVRLTLKRCR